MVGSVGVVTAHVMLVSELLAVLSAADLEHAAALAAEGRSLVSAEVLAGAAALLVPALRQVLAGPAGGSEPGPDGPRAASARARRPLADWALNRHGFGGR